MNARLVFTRMIVMVVVAMTSFSAFAASSAEASPSCSEVIRLPGRLSRYVHLTDDAYIVDALTKLRDKFDHPLRWERTMRYQNPSILWGLGKYVDLKNDVKADYSDLNVILMNSKWGERFLGFKFVGEGKDKKMVIHPFGQDDFLYDPTYEIRINATSRIMRLFWSEALWIGYRELGVIVSTTKTVRVGSFEYPFLKTQDRPTGAM